MAPDRARPDQPEPWWRSGSVYQIYVRSFADADGDGVGDIPGIVDRLDYVAWLGVDAIWLTPFYRSPMADFGYDVSDHADVDPLFGSLADMDRLLAQAHARGLRVIVDYVPNHTSDRHPWFVESRASRESPRRDWYFWRDPRPGGGLPNNWLSLFGGPAWEWDEASGQYYLHTFLSEQPDLNWRNPAVREAMFDVARFWLDRGVDGFRIDVASAVMKDPELRDNPPEPNPREGWFYPEWAAQRHVHDFAHPDVYEVWRAFRRLVDEHPGGSERVTIAEVPSHDLAKWAAYYGPNLDAIHLPFGFHLLRIEWSARTLRRIVDGVEAAVPAGTASNWVLGNHDQPRIASIVGPERARLATMLLLTLRGSPTLYYGDELGLTDVAIPPDRVRDPWEWNVPGQGRDPARTPMPWDDGPNAGFSPPGVEPWLPIGPDHPALSVACQRDDERSTLSLTRRLLTLRRELGGLAGGGYRALDGVPDGCFAYERATPGQAVVVALNWSEDELAVALARPGRIACTTGLDRDERLAASMLRLRPAEGCVVVLDGSG